MYYINKNPVSFFYDQIYDQIYDQNRDQIYDHIYDHIILLDLGC